MAENVEELRKQVLDFAGQIIGYKANRPDTLYIFSLYQGGDTLKLAAYSHHLKAFYPQQRIAIVCLQKHSVVAEMFDHIDEVIPMDAKEKDILEMASQDHSYMYGPNWI